MQLISTYPSLHHRGWRAAGIVVTFAIILAQSIPSDPWLIMPRINAFFLVQLYNQALSVLIVLVGG